MSICLQIKRVLAKSISLDANVELESTASLFENDAYNGTINMLTFLLL